VRILFLTPFAPDPVAPHGGGSYLGALAGALAARAELGIVHLQHAQERTPDAAHWQWQRAAPYDGDPGANNSAQHRLRMLWRWRRRPLLAAKYWQPALIPLLQSAREQFRPDVALVEMAQMAQYLPFLQGTPTVLTDHEAGPPANAGTGLGAAADRRDARLWRRYVREHYARADVLQALTDDDAASLREQTGRDVHVRAPAMLLPDAPVHPGEAPPRALFLGDYRHGPNPEAAAHLARRVLPFIRAAMPDAELWLAGGHEQSIEPLRDLPGVRVLGFVPDLRELLAQVRLVLAPLWSGGGFRVKNATALAHGVPVVSNALGSRGCRAPSPAVTIAEDDEGLAQGALELLRSPELAARGGELARRWARDELSPDSVAEQQLHRIDELLRSRR